VDSRAGMKTVVKPDANLKAPIQSGQKVGTLTVTAPEFPNLTVPVYATQPVAEVGIFGSMLNSLQRLWKK
jgi:D-alanyl-D-alanine carboxypeptidase (penicillin-binding protein 5/6)